MPVVRQGRPPDGGWGWMVIAGAFLTLFVLAVFSLGYSILFSEFLMSHGASSATIAWIFNLHVFLWNAVGVFTGPLTKEMGFRKVSMIATFLASISLFFLVFADSIWYLLVFYALAVFGFLQDLTHIQVAMAVWGCGVGINISLIVLLMPHFMGAEKTPAVFGVHSLFLSFSLITIGPIFGLVRDWSKSYTVTMLVMGITAGLSVLLWCLMPAAIAHDKRIEEEQGRKEQEEAERKV